MRRLLTLLAALLLVVVCQCEAHAGIFRRCKPRPVPYVTQRVAYQHPVATMQAVPTATATIPVTYTTTVVNGYDAALATINAWRALSGRWPLMWDANLAAWAASNAGVHSTMAPGASQCWAGVSDPVAAARMWIASPAHASILLNATTSIGISTCPSGMTCNAR